MAHDIDGFAVLCSISAKRKAFADVAAEANKAARALVVKQITVKNIDLKLLRDVREALDEEAFDLILDGMKDSQIKSVLAKLDKHHAMLKTSNAEWRRNQVRGLAKGSVEPAAKPEREKGTKAVRPKSAAKKRCKTEEVELSGADDLVSFESAGAKRKR